MATIPPINSSSEAWVSAAEAVARVMKIIPSKPMAWEWLWHSALRSKINIKPGRQRLILLDDKVSGDPDVVLWSGDGMAFWPTPECHNAPCLDVLSIYAYPHDDGCELYWYCDSDDLNRVLNDDGSCLAGVEVEKGLRCQLASFDVCFSNRDLRYWCGETDEALRSSPPDEKRGRERHIGRPRAIDWDGVLIHLIGIADRDGLLGVSQSEIVRMIADWFVSKGREPPGDTMLKNYARRIKDELTGSSA